MQDEMSPERPDGLLYVIAYHLLLGSGALLYAMIILVTAVPHSIGMAQRDSLFAGGVLTLLLLVLVSALFAVWALLAARSLWMRHPNARAMNMLLSLVMLGICAMSIPALFIAFPYDHESPMRNGLIATAAGLALLSGLCLRYLTRPPIRAYFSRRKIA